MKFAKWIAAGLAFAAIGSAGAAQTSRAAQCMTEAELSGLVIYALPGVINAGQTSCARTLAPNGFMATGGARMAQRYAARADANWPLAKSAFFKFGQNKGADADMMRQLPDNAVRPLIDAVIVQMVSEEIKPASCRDIERLMQALSTLEPEQAGTIASVIASLALKDEKDVPICASRVS